MLELAQQLPKNGPRGDLISSSLTKALGILLASYFAGCFGGPQVRFGLSEGKPLQSGEASVDGTLSTAKASAASPSKKHGAQSAVALWVFLRTVAAAASGFLWFFALCIEDPKRLLLGFCWFLLVCPVPHCP